MKLNPFVGRASSFKHALNGLKILFRDEHNARIHLFATVVAIMLGFCLSISLLEWMAIFFSIGLVFAFEIFNTSIEHIANFISPEKHESIKRIKDLAAGAVLISSITALIIGVIVFLPKILALFDN